MSSSLAVEADGAPVERRRRRACGAEGPCSAASVSISSRSASRSSAVRTSVPPGGGRSGTSVGIRAPSPERDVSLKTADFRPNSRGQGAVSSLARISPPTPSPAFRLLFLVLVRRRRAARRGAWPPAPTPRSAPRRTLLARAGRVLDPRLPPRRLPADGEPSRPPRSLILQRHARARRSCRCSASCSAASTAGRAPALHALRAVGRRAVRRAPAPRARTRSPATGAARSASARRRADAGAAARAMRGSEVIQRRLTLAGPELHRRRSPIVGADMRVHWQAASIRGVLGHDPAAIVGTRWSATSSTPTTARAARLLRRAARRPARLQPQPDPAPAPRRRRLPPLRRRRGQPPARPERRGLRAQHARRHRAPPARARAALAGRRARARRHARPADRARQPPQAVRPPRGRDRRGPRAARRSSRCC